jgi:hypothetical protein
VGIPSGNRPTGADPASPRQQVASDIRGRANVVVCESDNNALRRGIEPVRPPALAGLSLTAHWLGRTPSINNCLEVCLALRTTAATLELRSLFDRKRHMMDVAVDLR